jgi:hypothetical protein
MLRRCLLDLLQCAGVLLFVCAVVWWLSPSVLQRSSGQKEAELRKLLDRSGLMTEKQRRRLQYLLSLRRGK